MRKINLTMTYDAQVDACYIYLVNRSDIIKPTKVSLTTKPVNDNIILDFSQDGKLFGIEILNASETLGLKL